MQITGRKLDFVCRSSWSRDRLHACPFVKGFLHGHLYTICSRMQWSLTMVLQCERWSVDGWIKLLSDNPNSHYFDWCELLIWFPFHRNVYTLSSGLGWTKRQNQCGWSEYCDRSGHTAWSRDLFSFIQNNKQVQISNDELPSLNMWPVRQLGIKLLQGMPDVSHSVFLSLWWSGKPNLINNTDAKKVTLALLLTL